MQVTNKILGAATAGLVAIVITAACGDDTVIERAAPTPAPSPTGSAELCPAGTKRCAGACVPTGDPATGCTSESCSPCALAHASATCSGACAVGACENGWGDCNGAPADGCETDLSTTASHCGVCGKACSPDQICRGSTCSPRAIADAEAWLATQTEGFCLDEYNKILNLCGDVEFCFDPKFMRTYPNGVAIDVGFVWEGAEMGNVVALGGDCDGKALGIGTEPGDGGPATLFANAFGRPLTTPLTKSGKHLVSLQVNALGAALFVDGLRVSTSGPPPNLQLLDACGPGLIVGQRISYWWEAAAKAPWNRMAVFLVHLRENIPDTASYSVTAATTPQPGTVLLFDRTAAHAASRWTARIGGVVAVGKNAQNEDPQVDAGPSGPLPIWKPLAQCALK